MFKVGDKVVIQGNGEKVFTFISFNETFNYATVADDKFVYAVLIHNLMEYEDAEKEKKQPSFSIKEGSVESAARFIIANNSYKPYANIKECEDDIKRYIRRMIEQIKSGEESYILSTAGWTILIGLEDEDYYGVEVLVNPSVSQDREFVNVETII